MLLEPGEVMTTVGTDGYSGKRCDLRKLRGQKTSSETSCLNKTTVLQQPLSRSIERNRIKGLS